MAIATRARIPAEADLFVDKMCWRSSLVPHSTVQSAVYVLQYVRETIAHGTVRYSIPVVDCSTRPLRSYLIQSAVVALTVAPTVAPTVASTVILAVAPVCRISNCCYPRCCNFCFNSSCRFCGSCRSSCCCSTYCGTYCCSTYCSTYCTSYCCSTCLLYTSPSPRD